MIHEIKNPVYVITSKGYGKAVFIIENFYHISWLVFLSNYEICLFKTDELKIVDQKKEGLNGLDFSQDLGNPITP